ncbi:unnamed protein product [Effrenium voratum]|uniref:Uncharacterized protein n=1 Tax=Effrenium voratum TaxID=2562239 RepID=A0AA36ML02_9DINO|nr:unnamed protein product [Effrenium voratum]
MRPMRIFAAAFLLAEVAQGVRPDRELDDGFMMFDQAELKRVSDALKNGDMAAAVASNLERQRRSPEVVTGNMATSQAALQIAQDVPEATLRLEDPVCRSNSTVLRSVLFYLPGLGES